MNLVPVALDGVTLIFMFHVYITVKIFAVQIIEGYVMLTGASKHVASYHTCRSFLRGGKILPLIIC